MFRLVNVDRRAALEHDGAWYDLARLSGDPALADPLVAVSRHHELHEWHTHAASAAPGGSIADVVLGAPVPMPRQSFGIGLNYREHAAESGAPLPPAPLTFTKFPSCITGPTADVPLSGDQVDWEVEIVAVIGAPCTRVARADAWGVVAGLMLGQDISNRAVQKAGLPPQFSLGKSFANFGPTGPALVSVDSFADPNDVGLWCDVNGERVQDARSRDLIFDVPTLVEYLSSICALGPGDVIFTGTPPGVGMGRGWYLKVGDVVASGAEVIGSLRNRCVAGAGPVFT